MVSILLPWSSQAQRVNFTTENGEYPAGLAPIAVGVSDLDGDGIVDLAVANYDGDDVSIFLGTGTGEFIDTGLPYMVGQLPFALVIADVNGDEHPDIVTSCEGEDVVSVLLNDGFGVFTEERRFETEGAPQGLVVRDFDGDQKMDIATANSFDETVTVLKGAGDGNFASPSSYATGTSPMGLAAGDIDGDQVLDLVAANTAGGEEANGSLTFLKGQGDGTFLLRPEFFLAEVCGAVGCLPVGLEIADVNHDNKADLVVINQDGDSVGIHLGNGDFTFREPTVIEVSSTPAGSVLADFDGDENLDIATTGSFDNFVSVLLGVGDGTFAEPLDFEVGETPMGIAAGHFNGDGRIDLVVTNLDDETITVMLSAQGCSGDCDEDQVVEMSDLESMINLALGVSSAMSCSNGDTDASGGITVEEIVGAVVRATAGGCVQ